MDEQFSIPPVEPSAVQRQQACVLRGWYVALLDSGFTEPEAMHIIGVQLSS